MSALARAAAEEAERMQVPLHPSSQHEQSPSSHASYLPMPTAMLLHYQSSHPMGPNNAMLHLQDNGEATLTTSTGEHRMLGTWIASRFQDRNYISLSGVPDCRGRRRRQSGQGRLLVHGDASFEIGSYFFSDNGMVQLKLQECHWSPSLMAPPLAIEDEPIEQNASVSVDTEFFSEFLPVVPYIFRDWL